ncbi:MAG TPA: hypothetical protein VIE43_20305 [Thermoanaerobaculia bacterium]|jgi:hypothetical protein|nr:hypothetical protein [Thermoanaerobaculia bacterium]
MARRSSWRRLVLALLLMLVALPALAGERSSGRRGEGNGFAELWRTVVRWVAPSGWLAKLGPGIDPDGLGGGTAPPVGSGPAVQRGGGELGPEVDPNG